MEAQENGKVPPTNLKEVGLYESAPSEEPTNADENKRLETVQEGIVHDGVERRPVRSTDDGGDFSQPPGYDEANSLVPPSDPNHPHILGLDDGRRASAISVHGVPIQQKLAKDG